jgi:outer membrane protein
MTSPRFAPSLLSTPSGVALLVLSVAAAAPAWGQGMGAPMGGAPSAGAPTGASAGAQSGGGFSGGGAGTSASSGSASASAGGGPDSLFGLKASDNPRVVTLEDAVRITTEKNYDLRIASERIVQSEANVRRAWAALLPQVSLGGSYTFNYPEQRASFGSDEQTRQQALLYRSLANITDQTSVLNSDPQAQAAAQEQAAALRGVATTLENSKAQDIVINPYHVLGANVSVTLPIFNGRALPLLQNAYEAVDLAKLGGDQAAIALAHAVARAYYATVTTEKFVVIAERQLQNSMKHRDATRDRVELGIATPLALQRAELDVLRAEQNVIASKNGMATALGALGNLMDTDESFVVAAPPNLPSVELEADEDGLIQRALDARPDLKVQKGSLAIADRNRLDAWMMFLPSVGLTAQGRWTSNTSGFVALPFTGAVILQASVPIYDGGTRYAALKESGSKIREELLKVRQLERKIAGQVRGNIADIAVKRQALITSRQSVELSQKTAENAANLYELGMATSLDVIDANLAVFLAEIDLARAELDLEQARLSLTYILGEMPMPTDVTPAELTNEEIDLARERMDAIGGE